MSRTGTAVSRFVLVAIAVLGVTASAGADPVTGSLGFTGTGVLTFSTASGSEGSNFIDWCPLNTAGAPLGCNSAINAGIGLVSTGTATGDFVVDVPGGVSTQGTILDMTDNPAAPPYTYVPVGTAINVVGFLDFIDPWTYTLKLLDEQTCATTADQLCVGAFKLVDAGDSVGVTMTGDVWVTNGLGEITAFELVITTQFAAADIETFLTLATSPTGALSKSWSGELTGGAPIPEPATLLTFGTGSLLLAAHKRRKAKKNRA